MRKLTLLVGAVAMCVACGKDDPEPEPECRVSLDCGLSGFECVEGLCVPVSAGDTGGGDVADASCVGQECDVFDGCLFERCAACTNDSDLAIISTDSFDIFQPCIECWGEPGCVQGCFPSLSTDCRGCVQAFTECVSLECMQGCIASDGGEACDACMGDCSAEFDQCGGMWDRPAPGTACLRPADLARSSPDEHGTTALALDCAICRQTEDAPCESACAPPEDMTVGCYECFVQRGMCLLLRCEEACAEPASEACVDCAARNCRELMLECSGVDFGEDEVVDPGEGSEPGEGSDPGEGSGLGEGSAEPGATGTVNVVHLAFDLRELAVFPAGVGIPFVRNIAFGESSGPVAVAVETTGLDFRFADADASVEPFLDQPLEAGPVTEGGTWTAVVYGERDSRPRTLSVATRRESSAPPVEVVWSFVNVSVFTPNLGLWDATDAESPVRVSESLLFGQQVGPLGREPGGHVLGVDTNRDGSADWILNIGDLSAGTDLVIWWAGDSSGAPTVAVTDRTGTTKRVDATAVVD